MERKPDDIIRVTLDIDDEDLTAAESKQSYLKLKDFILQNYGVKVSTLYIAQVKRELGFEMKPCYYKAGENPAKVPQIPDKKREFIIEAMKHFKMI